MTGYDCIYDLVRGMFLAEYDDYALPPDTPEGTRTELGTTLEAWSADAAKLVEECRTGMLSDFGMILDGKPALESRKHLRKQLAEKTAYAERLAMELAELRAQIDRQAATIAELQGRPER